MSHAWMPLYVADYLADTGHLSTIEHGAYMLLIMHYWQKGGLPADERMIARVARMTADQWAESRDVLATLFSDGWKHKRIDAELAKATEIVGKRKAAAEHRYSKRNAHAVQVKSTCSDTRVPQSPSPEKEDANASSKKREKPAPEFEAWYGHYPHKVQRGAAEKAFAAARKLASLDELIAGVQRYVASKPPDRQWQNPATWLNGKGWLDSPAVPPMQAQPRAGAPPPPRVTHGPVAALARRYQRQEPHEQIPEIGSRDEDAQRIPADERRLQLVAGHLRAAVGGGFDRGG